MACCSLLHILLFVPADELVFSEKDIYIYIYKTWLLFVMPQWWDLCLYLISRTYKVEITNKCNKIIIFGLVCRYSFICIVISCVWNGGGSSNMHVGYKKISNIEINVLLNDQGWCCLTYHFFKASIKGNKPAWET